ncbi:MAG TPA: NAD(P)H-hydrate dehydratase [Casimicrobiaceae bacterium]|nr:NAD(P)H-hydrate dehydratase [Casimicrobiaceae bacterium]
MAHRLPGDARVPVAILDAMPLSPILTIPALRTLEGRHAHEPLMERAGAAAAEIAAAMLGSERGPVVVLAGPGNNGGDAYVAARRLRERGANVHVVAAGDIAALPADAAAACRSLRATGAELLAAPPAGRPALIVDGLFGVGLSRALTAPHANWVDWANASGAPILALDAPSGLDAATGVAQAPTIVASATATFIALKPGLLTADGPDHCGAISVQALGIGADIGPAANLRLEWPGIATGLPVVLARRRRATHKGSYGSVCVVGGADGMVGAPLLAGRAALRAGAGRVVVCFVAEHPPVVDVQSPELMLRDAQSPERSADAWVVGPGLSRCSRAMALTAGAIARDEPLVLDADALNIVAVDETLREAIAARRAPTLLTPHPAEAARLLRSDTAAVQADRVGSAVTLATALRAQVVLKGNGSIVARPDGSFDINASGGPALATAGSGDVLAGILGALLAQGIAAATAMRIGVCLHGAAADALVAQGTGPMGLCASELIDAARALVNDATRPPARR